MTTMRKAFARATIGTFAAGAMALTATSPAHARDRDRGISAGEVIAGAVVLGGLAAVIASSSRKKDRHSSRDFHHKDFRDKDFHKGHHRGRGFDRGFRGDVSRVAIEECIYAAERVAQRRTGARAEVFEIRDIDRERGGFEVEGRIAVQDNFRGRKFRSDYRRGFRNADWDEGRFRCDWRRGRVVDIDFGGIRGL